MTSRVMLAFASGSEYVPGSNLRGEQVDEAWLYVLPRLDLRRALVVGVPSAGVLRGLAALGIDLTIQVDSRHAERSARRRLARHDIRGVETLVTRRPEVGSCDLAYVAAGAVSALAARSGAIEALRAVLSPGACLYFEPSGAIGRLAERLGASAGVLLAPAAVEPAPRDPLERAAQPLERGDTAPAGLAPWLIPAAPAPPTRLRANLGRIARRLPGAVGRSAVRGRSASGAAEPLSPLPLAGREVLERSARGDHGLLLRPCGDDRADPLPAYLRSLAEETGHRLPAGPWWVLAPRGYRSQKTIFMVSGDGREPDAVVKLTQDPAFNRRLDNEGRALRMLQDSGLTGAAGAPRLLFSGTHAGLSVVGQSRLAGVPFHARSDGGADCPWARAAIERLTALGAASAHPVEPQQLPIVAAALVDRFIGVYRPPDRAIEQLRAVLRELGASPPAVGVVLHGDPTPLNLLTDADGSIAMVDWENAETTAPPLWDLFYFAYSYTARWGSARGRRSPVEAFEADLLAASPFRTLLADAVYAYRQRVALSPELVDPLFVICWTYLALRQARQLTPDALRRSSFARTLALALDHRARAGALPWTSPG